MCYNFVAGLLVDFGAEFGLGLTGKLGHAWGVVNGYRMLGVGSFVGMMVGGMIVMVDFVLLTFMNYLSTFLDVYGPNFETRITLDFSPSNLFAFYNHIIITMTLGSSGLSLISSR